MTTSPPHPVFERFLENYKSIAKANGVSWHTPTNESGQIIKAFRWDLNEITGAPKPPAFYLKDLGTDLATLKALASGNPDQNQSLEKIPLSDGWADLIKALTIRSLFELRNSAHYTCNAIGRSVRALASCCCGSRGSDDDGPLSDNQIRAVSLRAKFSSAVNTPSTARRLASSGAAQNCGSAEVRDMCMRICVYASAPRLRYHG